MFRLVAFAKRDDFRPQSVLAFKPDPPPASCECNINENKQLEGLKTHVSGQSVGLGLTLLHRRQMDWPPQRHQPRFLELFGDRLDRRFGIEPDRFTPEEAQFHFGQRTRHRVRPGKLSSTTQDACRDALATMIRYVLPDTRIDIVIPMAGHGSRFSEAGYSLPKPLIDVRGKPMIARVIENLRPSQPHRFIFVVLQQHLDEHNVADVLSDLSPGCSVVPISSVTRGAAETVLMVEEFAGQGPLVIANSDQWVDTSLEPFYDSLSSSDGTILTMTSSDPKWSYIERSSGQIIRIVEKIVVSNEATVGIYGFREAGAFFESARHMIATNDTSQGEFYVAPTYTYLVNKGAHLEAISIGSESSGMWGLGTPADLETFLASEPARRLAAA